MTERTIYQYMMLDDETLDVDAVMESLASVWLGAVYGAG